MKSPSSPMSGLLKSLSMAGINKRAKKSIVSGKDMEMPKPVGLEHMKDAENYKTPKRFQKLKAYVKADRPDRY